MNDKMPKYRIGQQVMLRNNKTQIGTISKEPDLIADTFSYLVNFPNKWANVLEDDLEAIESREPEELFKEGSFAGPESLLRIITFQRLAEPFSDTFLTRHANRIDFLPYQWMPLLRILNTADSRILIADEVGLGKTIEAGIILRELEARSGGLSKVLVIARAGHLNRQWQDEMRERFGLDLTVWDSIAFIEWLDRGYNDNYFGPINAIIGRHTLMRDPTYHKLTQICTIDGEGKLYSHPKIDLDLLIVDESHHIRNVNNLHRAIDWLARTAKNVIFLTATPINLLNDDLFNQLRILLPKRFAKQQFFQDELKYHQIAIRAIKELFAKDKQALTKSLMELANGQDISDIIKNLDSIDSPMGRARLKQQIESFSPLSNIINRTTRRNIPYVDDWPKRRALSLTHPMSEQEKNFYFQLWIEHFDAIQNGDSFGKTMALRLASTCMPIAMQLHTIDSVNEEEGETPDERGEYEHPNGATIDFKHLASLPDSRFEKLIEALNLIWTESPNSKVIVFCFFVDVLRYLSKRFNNLHIGHVMVFGGIPAAEREQLYETFLDPKNKEVRVLLSSEVGSEGLNLQIADTIINYNLPWNPMVVEQRIGRIDRKGQKSPVIRIVNLFAEGTIEHKILKRLLERIKIFEASIGELEPILGNIDREITKRFANPKLSDRELQAELDKLSNGIEQ